MSSTHAKHERYPKGVGNVPSATLPNMSKKKTPADYVRTVPGENNHFQENNVK